MARYLTWGDIKDVKLGPYHIDGLGAISRRALELLDADMKKKEEEEKENEALHRDLLSFVWPRRKRSIRKPSEFGSDNSTEKFVHVLSAEEILRRERLLKRPVVADHGIETKKADDVLSREEILRRERLLKKPKVDDGIVAKKADNVLSHEEILRKERLLKKPMVHDEYKVLTRKAKIVLPREEILRRERFPKKSMVDDDDDDDDDDGESNDKDYSEASRNGKKKIKKEKEVIYHGPSPPPGLPVEFMNRLREVAQGKSIDNPVLVIQKGLYNTDISRGHNRFSIPMRLMANRFLTDEELAYLELYDERGKNVNKMELKIIEPSLEVGSVSLRRWAMKKKSSSPISISYVLTGTWNSIVFKYNLRKGDLLQVWAVRIDGILWLALVILPRVEACTSGTKEECSRGSKRTASASDIETTEEEEEHSATTEAGAATAPSEPEDDSYS